MHPVLFELGMLLTKNPISSVAAVNVLFPFSYKSRFPQSMCIHFFDKCLSYCLQVFKKCTLTYTQCISRIYTEWTILYHFPAFNVHFQFFSSSFFHICLSFYFSICFSRFAVIDVLFSLFSSLVPLCTQDYTKSTTEMLKTHDAETGITWMWIHWQTNGTHIHSHAHSHKTESHWVLVYAQRKQHTLNSTSRSGDTTMNDDIHCKTLACLKWNLLGPHSELGFAVLSRFMCN